MERVIVEVGSAAAPDVATLEAIARVALEARRAGAEVEVWASAEVVQIAAALGLVDVATWRLPE